MGNKIFNRVIIVSTILLLMIGVGIAYIQDIPNPGHGADSVWVSVDGIEMSLQDAIDNDLLLYLPRPGVIYTQNIPNPGHGADSVWVSVDGIEMSLQDAISEGTLCSTSSHTYTNNINSGHGADSVWVSVDGIEMSLQDAIDSSTFCCFSNDNYQCFGNDVYWYDSCGTIERIKESCGAGTCSGSSCVAPPLAPAIEYYWKFITACGLGHAGSVSTTIVCDSSRVGNQIPIVMGELSDQGNTITGVGGSCGAGGSGGPHIAYYKCTIR